MKYQTYWVKFQNFPPEKWQEETFDAFWHNLRENMLRRQLILEWIIYD